MRSVNRLITQIRRQTENEEVSDFTGIKDHEFLQYLNDAQYNLQAGIVARHPRVFIKEVVIDAVAGQEKYDLPSDCYLGNKVHNVEYSATGAEQDYFVLNEDTIKYRNTGVTGAPAKYIRLSGQLLLSPQPQDTGGKIRINYVKRLNELSKQSAKIAVGGVTINDNLSETNTFEIPLDINYITDLVMLEEVDHICIVDKNGNILVRNIELLTAKTDTLTCYQHTLNPGDISVIPEGSFIVTGKDSSSHSELDTSVERYLIAYCAWKILKRDSSGDSQDAMQELMYMAEEIYNSYSLISDDIQFVPQLNSWDDWSN